MAKAWYYAKNNQQLGPVTDDALRQMLQSGQLLPSDLVWADGMAEWVPASSVAEFSGQSAGPTPVTASPIGYRTPGMTGGVPPKSYLAESIFVTLCCCLPFGIVGIVYAAQVNSKFNAGDVAGAQMSSESAKKWITWGFAIGLIGVALKGIAVAMSSQHR